MSHWNSIGVFHCGQSVWLLMFANYGGKQTTSYPSWAFSRVTKFTDISTPFLTTWKFPKISPFFFRFQKLKPNLIIVFHKNNTLNHWCCTRINYTRFKWCPPKKYSPVYCLHCLTVWQIANKVSCMTLYPFPSSNIISEWNCP